MAPLLVDSLTSQLILPEKLLLCWRPAPDRAFVCVCGLGGSVIEIVNVVVIPIIVIMALAARADVC